MALKTFEEHSKTDVKESTINESSSSAFDYKVLADFCKVRNKSMAGSPTDEPTPRLQFIIKLLEKYGIDYELDIWSKERTSYGSSFFGGSSFSSMGGMNALYGSMYGGNDYYGSSIWGDDDDDDDELTLADFFGFEADDVETVFAQHPLQHQNKEMWEEEKKVTTQAFEWWNKSISDLKKMLQAAERDKESKVKKRVLNNLIKYKKLVPKQSSFSGHSVNRSYGGAATRQPAQHQQPAQKSEPKVTKSYYFNLYLKGTSDKMIMAHHDVANVNIDNCNDNSASVINAIACKLLMPELNVAITDGEENGGHGAQRTADKIKEGHFGDIDFVLNFELTAVGGTDFFVENHTSSALFQRIAKIFPNLETYSTPFHDGIILRRNDIDSVVINPLPRLNTGALDYSLLHYCHSARDTISLANYDDMKDFCEKVVTSIIRNIPAPHIDYDKIEEMTKAKAEKDADMVFENWYKAPDLSAVNLLAQEIMTSRVVEFNKGEVEEAQFENFIKYVNYNLKPKRWGGTYFYANRTKTEEQKMKEELEHKQKCKPAVTIVRQFMDNNPHLYETEMFEKLAADSTYEVLFDFDILKLPDLEEED